MTTTLLAVDDSKTMRRVFEITFSGEDFRTVLSDSADDALAKLAAERPQVALVDAGLEGSTGYELCQKIKASAPHVAVVMLASKQQPYDRARGSAVGADDFVDKPFDTQQMLDKVTALARKAASAPMAAPAPAPAPVVMAPMVSAAPKPEATRPRVQTLAYGASQTPNLPISPAPAPVAARPPMPLTPVVPAPAPVRAVPDLSSSPRASAPVASPAPAGNGMPADFASKLGGLGLSAAQVDAVLALSREVVEQVVWEVVPTLAETLIKEEIRRLTQD